MNSSIPTRDRRSHRGVSLVEMVVVVSISAIVFGVAISGFATLWRLDDKWGAGAPQVGPEMRLIDSLRRDGHAAEELEWLEAESTLVFTPPAGPAIRYEITGDRCERRAAGDATPSAVYRLPAPGAWSAEPATAERGKLVVVTLRFEPTEDAGPKRTEPIAIAVGLDQSLTQTAVRPPGS